MLILPKPSPGFAGYSEALPRLSLDVTAAVQAIQKHATRFDFSNPGSAVGHIFEDARIIGLGEGSHGTAEFFRVQTEVTRYLIEKKNVRLVLAELLPGLAEAMNIVLQLPNEIVTQRIEDTIRQMPFETWSSNEFEELFGFIYNWNRSHPDDPVVFRGIDVSHTNAASVLRDMHSVSPEIKRTASELTAQLAHLCEEIFGFGQQNVSRDKSQVLDSLDGVSKAANPHLETLKDNRPAYFLVRSISQTAELLKSCAQNGESSQGIRDLIMASNISEEVGYLAPNKRAVVLAHNAHVSFGDPSDSEARFSEGLGQALRREFGSEQYRVLICTSGGGSVTSRAAETRPSPGGGGNVLTGAISNERKMYESQDAVEGSLEYLFLQAVTTPVSLSVETMFNDERLCSIATSPIALRSMGCGLLLQEFRPVRLAACCDGIIFFPSTKGSKLYQRRSHK